MAGPEGFEPSISGFQRRNHYGTPAPQASVLIQPRLRAHTTGLWRSDSIKGRTVNTLIKFKKFSRRVPSLKNVFINLVSYIHIMMFIFLKMRTLFLAATLISFTVLVFGQSRVNAQPSEAYIYIPYHHQIKSYYCGPAALEMIFDFYNADILQVEIADVARTSSQYGTFTCDMVRAAHFSNLSTSVGREMSENITGYTGRGVGFASFERGGVTIEELKFLIAEGYPIGVLTGWHFKVAVGYNNTHFTFQDSLWGEMLNMTYTEFLNDWTSTGNWSLFVSPWKVNVSAPRNPVIGETFNVTATITYPCPSPFFPDQYFATMANATIRLPDGLSLVPSEEAKKPIGTGEVAPRNSANVTWTVQAGNIGRHTISVEAEGLVSGFMPPVPPNYPEYNYEDRIGGAGQSMVVVTSSPALPDVAVTNVTTCKDGCLPMSVVGQDHTVHINVTVSNEGEFPETFNVSTYANSTEIGKREVTLDFEESTTIVFTWNTIGFVKGNYTIWAYAWPAQDETDTADNNFTNSVIYVGLVGDVNADEKVDMKDVGICSMAYGTTPGHPKWNPNADINDDHKVEMKDVGIACKNYGKTDL